MKGYGIVSVNCSALAKSVIGQYSGLQGDFKIQTADGSTMELSLSRESLKTIEECVHRDFDVFIGEFRK